MIVITGATGQLGTKIVDQLLALVPAPEIGVSVRDVGRAAGLAERGVRVRRGDFNEPESLAGAFEGASRVLVISSNETGADAVAQHVAAIDAARAAGAERVLYTSHQASATDSRFAPMPDHARTEAYLREQGGAFTSLRNGFYTSTVGWLVGQAATTGTLVAPADGPVSWTTHDDLAEAAAIALADDGRLDGITAPLTAPEAIDLEAVAAILSDLVGRTVTRVVVDDEEYRATMIAHGAPEQRADFLLGLFAATRRGEFDVTDPTLERLLDRPALSVRAVLARLVGA